MDGGAVALSRAGYCSLGGHGKDGRGETEPPLFLARGAVSAAREVGSFACVCVCAFGSAGNDGTTVMIWKKRVLLLSLAGYRGTVWFSEGDWLYTKTKQAWR